MFREPDRWRPVRILVMRTAFTDLDVKAIVLRISAGLLLFHLSQTPLIRDCLHSIDSLPAWADDIPDIMIGLTAYLLMGSLRIVRVRLHTDFVSISDFPLTLLPERIPCRDVVGVYVSKTPAARLVRDRLGVGGVARAWGSGVCKHLWKYYLGSTKGQTLLIDTTGYKYIVSCPDPVAAAAAIRNLCGLPDRMIDAEQFVSEAFPAKAHFQ